MKGTIQELEGFKGGGKEQSIRASVRSVPSNPTPFANAKLLPNKTPSKNPSSSLSFRIRAMDSLQPSKLFPA